MESAKTLFQSVCNGLYYNKEERNKGDTIKHYSPSLSLQFCEFGMRFVWPTNERSSVYIIGLVW